tara:strand:+ start:167 stop:577 length:411 start_codon:yes stop_codon:yes gene_type:complete
MKGKKFDENVFTFFNKRKLNDVVDGRVPYEAKPGNSKEVSKTKCKILKNVFLEKKEDEILIKIFKKKSTEMPVGTGDTYGELELSQCNTPDKMLGQIRYLTGFDWCTKDIIDQFLHTVEAAHVSMSGSLLFTSEGR